MGQSEFSVAGATGNSNASVTVKERSPFLSRFPPVSSRLFLLAPVSPRCAFSVCELGSITSRCSGNEPTLIPEESLLGEESRTRGSGGNRAYLRALSTIQKGTASSLGDTRAWPSSNGRSTGGEKSEKKMSSQIPRSGLEVCC